MRKWLFFVKKRLNKSSRKLNKIDTSFRRISAFDCQCYANYALTYNLCNHMSLRCRLLSLYSGRIRDHLLIYEYMSGLFQIWSVCIEKSLFHSLKAQSSLSETFSMSDSAPVWREQQPNKSLRRFRFLNLFLRKSGLSGPPIFGFEDDGPLNLIPVSQSLDFWTSTPTWSV